MWGNVDGRQIKEHALGKGHVIWGPTPEEVLGAAGVGPDCVFENGSGRMVWIHRVVDGADVYFVANQSPRAQEVDAIFRVSGKTPELWHAETGWIEGAPLWSEQGGRTTVPLRLDPSGSVFVVFRTAAGSADHFAFMKRQEADPAVRVPKLEVRKAMYEAVDGAGGADVTKMVAAMVKSGQFVISANNTSFGDPAFNHVKRLRVEFSVDGKALTSTVEENGTLELLEFPSGGAPAPYTVAASAAGGMELRAFRAGTYEFQTAKGRTVKAEIKQGPKPIEIGGPWTVTFPPQWGAPASITLDKLISWTEHAESGVRYFSGTAEYEREFEIAEELLGTAKELTLDLGSVKVIAEVTLNGKDLGIWWKPPFAADISAIARPGRNTLRVRVTNLWCNRLIGDEQLPEDVEWNGKPIKKWPKWLVDGTPRTSGRLTFTTWHHYTRDSALVESGLIGPVLLRPGVRVKIDLPAKE
jgi:hypothetical protein